MKLSKGKIILIVIVVYFTVFAVININKEKDSHSEILDEVTIVTDGKVKKENEGKLVLVTGKISYDGKVSFLELDKEIDSFKVTRVVKDYKKYEESGKTKTGWVEREELDENAEKSDDYLKKITSEEVILDTNVGEFKLDEVGMSKIKASELYRASEKVGDLEFCGLYYCIKENEDNPKLGDMTITYSYYNTDKNKYLSILAVQKGDSFVPYKVEKNEYYYVYNGKVDTLKKLEKELGEQVKKDTKGKSLFIFLILGLGIFFIVDAKKK